MDCHSLTFLNFKVASKRLGIFREAGNQMTRYEELCQAYYAGESHRIAIDAIFRELPPRMKEALIAHLKVPPTFYSIFPMQVGDGTVVGYVDIYKRVTDEKGIRRTVCCEPDNYLQRDSDGILHFTIGIYVEQVGKTPGMAYIEFTIESVDEKKAELLLVGTNQKLSVALDNPSGYADAAVVVATTLREHLKNPPPTTSLRGPLGY